MKRIVSLMLALSMILSMFASAIAVEYTDLSGENQKFASAVDALTELKVIDGFPDETFRPLDKLTRAQVAKMLVICLGLGDQVESLSAKTVFSDVASSHWAAGYINAAAQSKIIVGYPDGTFKPEKEVTYAEAFTMALRALGYGNVVEAEGTWPTAYMLKAVELELTDDMEGVVADSPALRGNTAILLWNMLRTPMWKIYEESQGNGMTLTALDDLMLNVKFPKYWYYEDVYLAEVVVDQSDDKKVEATLIYADGDIAQEAYVRVDTDISRLVLGSKVSSLVKDYKDDEKATFLTLTREYEFVEGLVTNADKLDEGKIEIENVEYKLGSGVDFPANMDLAENDFVVVEVDGKKIIGFGGDAVLKTLPNEGTEVTKVSTLKSKIDEDALVIIDGEWKTREDIQEGDVYTKLTDTNDTITGDAYFMVARERVTGDFESLTYMKDDNYRMYFEVDGEQYRTFEDEIDGNVYEIRNGEKEEIEDAVEKLTKKKSENDYLDKEVELVINYLGQVIKAYFEDVRGGTKGANFYAVMSNGIWKATDPETGDSVLKIRLANGDDEDGAPYNFSSKFTQRELEADWPEVANEVVFENAYGDDGEVVFVWAKLNDDDEIKSFAVISPDLSGDPYDDDYAFIEFAEPYDKSSRYLTTDEGNFKVTSETVVYKLTPEEDEEDDKIVGFNFEVADDAHAALQGVDKGLIAYDKTTKINKNGQIMTASFVFIMEDAVSADLEIGKVTKVFQQRGLTFVCLDGADEKDAEEVDLDNKKSDVESFAEMKELHDSFVVFQRSSNNKLVVKGSLETSSLSEASIVMTREDSIVQLEGGRLSGDIDLDNDDDPLVDEFEDYQIMKVTATVNENDEVEFDEGENVGTGLPAGTYTKGDRVYVDDTLEVIYIVTVDGVDEKDVINEDGTVTYEEDIEEDDDDDDDDEDDEETFTVTYAWASGTPDAIQAARELPTVDPIANGETYTVVAVEEIVVTSGDEGLIAAGFSSGETIAFECEPEVGTVVSGDTEITVSYID